MKCPKCNAEMNETLILGSKRQKCPKCSYLNYDLSGKSGGYSEIENEILSDVAKMGSHRTMTEVLINTIFRGKPGSPADKQIEEWAKAHEFSVIQEDGKDAHGKKCKFIVFSRRT